MAPTRRSQLALLITCCFSGGALAQAGLPPLPVDPALLGLPPRPAAKAEKAPPVSVQAVAPAAVTPVAEPSPPTPARQAARPAQAGTPAAAPAASASRIAPSREDASRDEGGRMALLTPEEAASGLAPGVVEITADRISGIDQQETVAEGRAVLRRDEQVLEAERLRFLHETEVLEAEGDVRLRRPGETVAGARLSLDMGDQTGSFESLRYRFRRTLKPAFGAPLGAAPQEIDAQGHAESLEFRGEEHYRLNRGTFSTCPADAEDWFVRADRLDLDYGRALGKAEDGAIVFKGSTILKAPWLDFPLDAQRKSGFLPPTYGSSSKSGLDLTLPYYWDIAPNRDATLATRILSRRGLQLNGEFRYLEPSYRGTVRAEWMPEDSVRGGSRHAWMVQHNQAFAPGLAGALNLNGVSDDYYFTDLSSRLIQTSQTNLLRDATVTYASGWWNARGRLQTFQTLQPDPLHPVAVPYQRLPQLNLNARRTDFLGSELAFNGEFVAFRHPTQTEGQRVVAYPQISYPLVTPAFEITPKIGAHVSQYSLSQLSPGTPDSASRALPIFSIDGTTVFERDWNLRGTDFIQTLEPRLYYLYVPYRDQSRIPVFDTALADFNFAQIFSENLFAGNDRIADANQLTAAISSRLILPETGEQVLRAMLGQRYYFRDQLVTLPGVPARAGKEADILAALSGRIAPHTLADVAWQYNPRDERSERFTVSGRYLPEAGKVFNVSYRFQRDPLAVSHLRQIDVSGQWPLGGRWYGAGRFNYSIADRRPIESVAGVEYDGGCWIARAVLQRFTVAAQPATTAIFLQLELSGFSRIGSNPLEVLKRNIQGYGTISRPTADPVFGEDR